MNRNEFVEKFKFDPINVLTIFGMIALVVGVWFLIIKYGILRLFH